jgi:hypothetical protein
VRAPHVEVEARADGDGAVVHEVRAQDAGAAAAGQDVDRPRVRDQVRARVEDRVPGAVLGRGELDRVVVGDRALAEVEDGVPPLQLPSSLSLCVPVPDESPARTSWTSYVPVSVTV